MQLLPPPVAGRWGQGRGPCSSTTRLIEKKMHLCLHLQGLFSGEGGDEDFSLMTGAHAAV